MLNKNSMLMALVMLCFQAVNAQVTYSDSELKASPVWIKMIDDPKANYYQAIKAYDLYWIGKLKPEQEEDILGEKHSKKEEREHEAFEKKLAALTLAEKNEYDLMVYECKRFENWKHEVFPYVQEDGRILTIEERIQIYNKQQEEIKNK